MHRTSLLSHGTVLLLTLLVAAWYSNPNDEHFQRWASRQVRQHAHGPVEDLAARAAARLGLAIADWERTDYGFFSIVTLHGKQPVYFVGAFGHWWSLPMAARGDARLRRTEFSFRGQPARHW